MKYLKKYASAFAASMAYSYWLIGSAMAIFLSHGEYDYFSLFLIMAISLIISALFFKKVNRLPLLSVFSGIAFSLGNILLYVLIDRINVVIAGSFTALNLVFFPLLIYTRGRRNLAKHLAGTFIVATGLIIESITLGNFQSNFLLISIIAGILLGFMYALATYLFNLSLIKDRSEKDTIFTVFLTETIVFGIITIALENFTANVLSNVLFTTNVVIVAISVFIGLYLESLGFRGLKVSEFRERNIVNVLSNLELLPIVVISIFEFPNYMVFYVTGLLLVIAGMIIISLK